MRIALAQINATVGDVGGNADHVLAAYHRAERRRADLVLFPELVLTGYPPLDLLSKRSFVEANLEALEQVAAQTGRVAAVVGFVDRDSDGNLYNAAAFLRRGQRLGVQHKSALPNYDVFFDKRYFSPARKQRLFELDGKLIGISICEDIWVEGPIDTLVETGANLILNLSASPFYAGKTQLRQRQVAATARRLHVPIALVNLVGGQDDLIYDGNSLVANAKGQIVGACAPFHEQVCLVGSQRRGRLPARMEPIAELYEALLLGIRDYTRKNNFRKVLVGLSGGIDSALVLALATRALGRQQVLAVSLPTRFTASASRRASEAMARNLGVRLITLPIENLRRACLDLLQPLFRDTPAGVAEENVQPRIRGTLLMALSNKFGYLVLTTGNKSEVATGYATLYGDMAGGFAVLSDVLKTTVYKLARHLNRIGKRETIPASILRRPPTAELRPGQKDTDALPPYNQLDPILHLYIEENLTRREIVARGLPAELVSRVIRMVDHAEYKRKQMPPGIRITPKAFGSGRLMPITNRWDEAGVPPAAAPAPHARVPAARLARRRQN
jgi:NAD+ synthase (glutamine-hydrolysing)